MRKVMIMVVPVLFLVLFTALNAAAVSNQPIHWGFTKGSKGKTSGGWGALRWDSRKVRSVL